MYIIIHNQEDSSLIFWGHEKLIGRLSDDRKS